MRKVLNLDSFSSFFYIKYIKYLYIGFRYLEYFTGRSCGGDFTIISYKSGKLVILKGC
jgi:hypothetical protein